jgi:hypothetical protein
MYQVDPLKAKCRDNKIVSAPKVGAEGLEPTTSRTVPNIQELNPRPHGIQNKYSYDVSGSVLEKEVRLGSVDISSNNQGVYKTQITDFAWPISPLEKKVAEILDLIDCEFFAPVGKDLCPTGRISRNLEFKYKICYNVKYFTMVGCFTPGGYRCSFTA